MSTGPILFLGKLIFGCKGMDVLISYFDIKPSAYSFIFPNEWRGDLDGLAESGIFPKVSDLFPAIKYCILLGFLRYVLFLTVFRVSVRLIFASWNPTFLFFSNKLKYAAVCHFFYEVSVS